MSDVFLKERLAYVKRHVTVVDLFKRYSWPLPANANSEHPFQVSCPFKSQHANGDRNKSMRIYPPDGFYCFTCGKGGDVFDLVSFALEDRTGQKPSLGQLFKYFDGICGHPVVDSLIADKIAGPKRPRVPKELQHMYSAASAAVSALIPSYSDTTFNLKHYMDRLDGVWEGVPTDLEGLSVSSLKEIMDTAYLRAEILFSPEAMPAEQEQEEEPVSSNFGERKSICIDGLDLYDHDVEF